MNLSHSSLSVRCLSRQTFLYGMAGFLETGKTAEEGVENSTGRGAYCSLWGLGQRPFVRPEQPVSSKEESRESIAEKHSDRVRERGMG